MGVRIILFVVLCVSFTLAEQTIFTNEEISQDVAVPNVPTSHAT